MKIILTFLLFLTIHYAFAQYEIAGNVELCPEFSSMISVKGRLTYSYTRRKRKDPLIKELDTLIADIKLYRGGQLFIQTITNPKGEFNILIPESGIYTIESVVGKMLSSKRSFIVDSTYTFFEVCISDSLIHQHFRDQIPFDKQRAKLDLRKGKIEIVSLYSEYSGCEIGVYDVLSEEDKVELEERYGFKYVNYFIEDHVMEPYLGQAENEYNGVVYHYLDSVNQINTKEEFRNDVFRMYKDKKSIKEN